MKNCRTAWSSTDSAYQRKCDKITGSQASKDRFKLPLPTHRYMSPTDQDLHPKRDASLRIWNLILFTAGVIYSAIMPFGYVSYITGLNKHPGYIAIFEQILNPLTALRGPEALPANLIVIATPIILITYILFRRKAKYSALALALLTAINLISGLIHILYLMASS